MPEHSSRSPSSLPRWFLPMFGIILTLASVTLASVWSAPARKQLPYSDFKTLLSKGLVEQVHIGSKTIQGILRHAAGTPDASARPQRFVTVRVADPHLLRDLEAHGVQYRGQDEQTVVTTLLKWLLPLGVGIVLWVFLVRRMGFGQGVLQFGKSRARVYTACDTGITFADVADAEEAKEELQEIIDFLRQPERYMALGGRIPKGVLLVGPPGTGKTLLARAVAGEAHVPFFSLSGSEFVEMFAGVGAARVRDLFQQAQEQAPSIVFVDELDVVGKARGIHPMQHNDEREQTLNQLLSEMDGFDSRKGIILLAATNRPEILDPALLRTGRIDRQVVVGRPDLHGRLRILRLYANQVCLAPDVDLQVIAARTSGMVGAELAQVINEATLLAARRNKQTVGMPELDAAVDRLMTGPERKSHIMAPEEKQRVAYYEAGHALVAEALPTADPVRKITIVPHGVAALGHTQQLPTQERYLYTRDELLDRIAVLLGGRAAEEVIWQDPSTGAQDDLQRASDMARQMVTAYGMSELLGPYAVEQESPASRLEGHEPSDLTAQCIDREAQAIVERMYQRALQILEEQRYTLETLAQYLLEHEVIDHQTLALLLHISTVRGTSENGVAALP
jgi:cell division protease FtsH